MVACTPAVRGPQRVAGDRAEISQHGYLNLVDGRLYIDEIPLEQMFGQFVGHHCYVSLIRPEVSNRIKLDDRIEPLVKAMHEAGYATLGCCQGHIGKDSYGDPLDRPYVSFLETKPFDYPLPEGWHVERRHFQVSLVTPRKRAENEAQLQKYQEQANELTKTISK